jgi:heterodisulfide reductase subunit A
MTTSLSLAEQGFEVYLVEKEAELGGHLRHIYYTIEKRDVQQFLKRIIAEVERQDLIKVFRGAHIESVSGFIGSYETEITTRENTKEKLKHGVIVVATGAKEYAPSEYERGRNPIVITQRELEAMIANSTSAATDVLTKAKSVVMIQCIGSRDTDHNYCSRICCSQTMKNAVKLLQISPDVSIYVLYRDIRTYGLKEDAYRKARESGVTFMRYSVSSKPRLFHENGVSRISVWEPILKENFELTPDLIVLSSGIEAEDGNKALAKMLKVPLNNEGFFLEAHVKLRPVDFATEGVFVAGMAHSPKDIDEAISQAEAAAARAAIIIAQDKYRAEAVVSHVNEDLCAGCGVCSTLCPYEAIEIVVENGVRKSKVNEALCKGCGTCASACPAGAMDQYGFARHQIMAMIEALE